MRSERWKGDNGIVHLVHRIYFDKDDGDDVGSMACEDGGSSAPYETVEAPVTCFGCLAAAGEDE